ncbi:MAG TPA: uracil-DNA glycosylase [Tepidisphaeraceae bacterium]|nr:uracil-DNA glycosylase [Tepidisphaeraceae bacterium]
MKSRVRLWLRSERAMGLPAVGRIPSGPAAIADMAANDVLSGLHMSQLQATMPPPPRVRTMPGPVSTGAPKAAGEQIQSFPSPRSNEPFLNPVVSAEAKHDRLLAIDNDEVRGCTKCNLCQTRSHTVFGEGDVDAQLMFIGEGPGAVEDQTGRPFVGKAGELLTRIIGAMNLTRQQVYIANAVKCRAFFPGPSPKDRAPAPDEMMACHSYLERQVEIIRPRVIVTLGLPASQHVLQSKQSMSRMRGQWHAWRGIKVMPTWHPAYLLRREGEGDLLPKRQLWADLQRVMAELGLAVPS